MSTMSDRNFGRGWRRADGRVGLRNHVVALSTVALTDRLTQIACERVVGILPVTAALQRGLRGLDAALQERVVRAIIDHPNTGAALVIAHDARSADVLRGHLKSLGKPWRVLALMSCGGFTDAIDSAVSALEELKAQASQLPACALGLGDLSVALECGGSDASSAVCANPAIGMFVDRLIEAGGTAIVSETAEFIGSEPVIRDQAASSDIMERILACLAREEAMMAEDGENYRGVNPTAENIEAGLTTLVEKTMGAVCKIGRSPIVGCLDYGERPKVAGLHFMDTPFFSPTSLTGMVAAGCQLTLFAMGVFNPSGNPLAPTIKVCGNPRTLAVWRECIDVDVSGLISGGLTLGKAGTLIADAVSACAEGNLTSTEAWGEGQFIVPRNMAAL